jgi:flavin-dependent dehydrogenase
MRSWDVVIVGGGPAGTAAALQLAARRPDLAERTLLLDRAMFPRHKLCGGGVVQRADWLLQSLGVSIEVPAVPIHAIRFHHGRGIAVQRGRAMFRVVRREDFDHALLCAARASGVTVQEGEAVRALSRERQGICILTSTGEHHARVVVGADGATSLVRRRFVGPAAGQRFVAVEVLTPEDPACSPAFRENTAVFDFRPVVEGIRGYAWDFPSFKAGTAVMNRGTGGATWPDGHSFKRALTSRLREIGATPAGNDMEGAAVPLYHPTTALSAERVVLAGDSVGVDPLMGEGISVAIGTGMLAAHAVVDAFEDNDFGFADFGRRVGRSSIGSSLSSSWLTAGTFYRRLRDGDAILFPESGLNS